MGKYITEKDYWACLRKGIFQNNVKGGVKDLVNLLKESDGRIFYKDHELVWLPSYDEHYYIPVGGSIIKKPEANNNFVDQTQRLVFALDEEIEICKRIVKGINDAFLTYPSEWKDFFVDKYIHQLSVSKINKKYYIYKNKHYERVNTVTRIVAEQFLMRPLVNERIGEFLREIP